MASATSNTNQKPATVRKIAKRVIDIVFTIMLVLAILVAVYIFQNKKTNGQVKIAGYQLFIVLSGSMSPAFDTGSVIFVKDITPEDIVVGDIVTFLGASDSGKTVTHRVIGITGEKQDLLFTTKGDANSVTDSAKQVPENVIGKVKYRIPYLGYFLEFARTKTGIYLLIVLPSLIIFMLEIRKVIGYVMEIMKEKKAKKTSMPDQKQPESSDERQIEFTQQELPKSVLSVEPKFLSEKITEQPARQIVEKPAEKIPEQPVKQIVEKPVVKIPEQPARQIAEKPVVKIPEQPVRQIAEKPAEQIPVQIEKPDIGNKATDLLTEVQNQSTLEIYKHRIQEENIKKELREKLDQKLKEEQELDRFIRQTREELLRKIER